MAVSGNMYGAPVGEYLDQFFARDARPMADRTSIHVHEGRAGGRIEADAATLQPQADLAQFLQRHAGNIEVHGVAERVLAELGDARGPLAQHGVGRRRAIAAHHVDRRGGADLAIDLPQQVEQMRVHARRLFLAPVAHEPVELLQRGVVVTAVTLVGDGDVFAGVNVMERERARVAFGDRGLQRHAGGEQENAGGCGSGADARERARQQAATRGSQCHWRCPYN